MQSQTSSQTTAYLILDNAREQIKNLPRFRGQQQIVDGLKRLLNLAVWSK